MNAIKLLSHEHKITTLCRVLNVNRSNYYKYINRKESNREKENRRIRTCILELYANTNKRLGANKIRICLKRDYRINISTGRGSQFTSAQFRRHMDNLNMIQFFSAKGHPYDNAVMECFFKYLKKRRSQ